MTALKGFSHCGILGQTKKTFWGKTCWLGLSIYKLTSSSGSNYFHILLMFLPMYTHMPLHDTLKYYYPILNILKLTSPSKKILQSPLSPLIHHITPCNIFQNTHHSRIFVTKIHLWSWVTTSINHWCTHKLQCRN